MKPIQDLEDSDIKSMSEETLRQYENESKALIDVLRLSAITKKQKFHDLANVLKQRGLDYKIYQVEAYNTRREYQTLLRQVSKEEGYFIRLLRDWNNFHNKNQVYEWKKTEGGREVLSL